MKKHGRVYLVGAGPGAPGLITVRGLECIRLADVIVYDHLIDESLLDEVPAGSEQIYAGKTAGRHSMPQEDINRLLVEKAQQGKQVVRLKGGDPFVLGRGGEEAESLQEAGVPFEIVPGVTSAVAVPAYAGIPVTHREHASYFTVLTGHEDVKKTVSGIPWEELARTMGTIVILMGAGNLPSIVEELLSRGMDAAIPAALIANGTTPEQRTVCGALGDIVSVAQQEKMAPPAIIVIGHAVSLRDKLRWFDNRPLFGKRILVTRPRHQAGELSRLLMERGALPVPAPAVVVEEDDHSLLDGALAKLKAYQWTVFTSANAVEIFFKRLQAAGLDARALDGLRIAAIGPATGKRLAAHGIRADWLPEVYTSRGILDGLARMDVAGQRFLLPRADIAGRELPDGLVRLGAIVGEVTLYKNRLPVGLPEAARSMLVRGQVDAATFTSPSTVANLLHLLGDEAGCLQRTVIACIGPVTEAAAREAGLRVDIVAREHTVEGLACSLEQYFEARMAGSGGEDGRLS